MSSTGVSKGPEAFRTISEASSELGVPAHVLRFWETKFSFIRPMKRAGGRRFYRPQDLAVLRGVHTLLHAEGYTIKGVQRLHKEEGVRRLIGAGEGDVPPHASRMSGDAAEAEDAVAAEAPDLTADDAAAEPLLVEEDDELFEAPVVTVPPAHPEPFPLPTLPEKAILKPGTQARLVGVLGDLEAVKAKIDRLLTESDA